MIVLGIPVYRRYDRLRKLLETVDAGTLRPDTYMIVDSGRNISRAIQEGVFVRPGNDVHVHTYHAPEQLNMAECWNTVIRHYKKDWIVLCRDESSHIERDTIEKLVKAAERSKELLVRASPDVHIQKPAMIENVGYYQEGRGKLVLPGDLEIEDVDSEMLAHGELVPPRLAAALFSRTVTVK